MGLEIQGKKNVFRIQVCASDRARLERSGDPLNRLSEVEENFVVIDARNGNRISQVCRADALDVAVDENRGRHPVNCHPEGGMICNPNKYGIDDPCVECSWRWILGARRGISRLQ